MNLDHRRRRQPKKPEPDLSSWDPVERAAFLRNKQMEMPIAEVGVSVRIVNTLEEHGIVVVRQLLSQTREDLLGKKNFGEKTLEELHAAVVAVGLEPPAWLPPRRPRPASRAKRRRTGG